MNNALPEINLDSIVNSTCESNVIKNVFIEILKELISRKEFYEKQIGINSCSTFNNNNNLELKLAEVDSIFSEILTIIKKYPDFYEFIKDSFDYDFL